MQVQVVLRPAVLIAALALCSCAAKKSFVQKGLCQNGNEQIYRYRVTQSQFDEGNEQNVAISCTVKVTCEARGNYGDKMGYLYKMQITNTEVGGNVLEREKLEMVTSQRDATAESKVVQSFDDFVKGWFKFFQRDDGSISDVFHSREERSYIVNFKKSIAAAFQANFKRTKSKMEADPQSLHVAKYSYDATAEDDDGTLKMHRTVTSGDVKDYASHIPGDNVALKKEEDIEYKGRVLAHSKGTTKTKLVPQKEVPKKEDVEEDSLEAETGRRRRNVEASATERPSYDPTVKINHFDAEGSYTLDLIGEKRVPRHSRSTENLLQLPDAVESNLLAFINLTQYDFELMEKLYAELGSIEDALEILHNDPSTVQVAYKIEELLKLEAKYGPMAGHSPTIDYVVSYLKQLLHSNDEQDVNMRILIYFMIHSEGSLNSQMTLLNALKSAVDEEEYEAVIMYVAFVANPQPQLVSELEMLIGSDVHSTDPLLLAYGAIIATASPELKGHMISFLLNRLPHAEMNSSSLIHHILSLGNTGSPHVTKPLIGYLQHPELHVQLSAISALRFMTNDTAVQEALTTFCSHPNVSEDHLAVAIQSLLYGIEDVANSHQEKPFNRKLTAALAMSVMGTNNTELHSALISYLQQFNTSESRQLIQLLNSASIPDVEKHSNGTRIRRGTNWRARNPLYNLVQPLSTRQADVMKYGYHKAYIWGKKFGVPRGNLQVAAGGFIGVSRAGDYKIFGAGKAVAHAFGRTKTVAHSEVFRTKTKKATHSKLYANIMGMTLINLDIRQDSSVCKRYDKPLKSSRQFQVFSFRYPVFIYVGTLTFYLRGHVQLSVGMFIKFCDNHGSISVTAGLTPTVTMTLAASAEANIVAVVKGGITVSAVFNYQVSPELSTTFCYKNYRIRVRNCAGIYHQWRNNKILLDVWYTTRYVKKCRRWGVPYPCGFGWSAKKKWDKLSKSWNLPSSRKRTLYQVCDRNTPCAVSRPVTRRPVIRRPVIRRPVIRRPVIRRPVIRRPVIRRPVTRRWW